MRAEDPLEAEEKLLLGMIAEHRKAFEQAIKPYIDRLARIKSMRPAVVVSLGGCACHACITERGLLGTGGLPLNMTQMIVCPICHNKRCPHAADHRNACTGSNEPDQFEAALGPCGK